MLQPHPGDAINSSFMWAQRENCALDLARTRAFGFLLTPHDRVVLRGLFWLQRSKE